MNKSQRTQALVEAHNCEIHIAPHSPALLKAVYTYDWDADASCKFSLLSEVAESLQDAFKRVMRSRGLQPAGTLDLEKAPFVQDLLTPCASVAGRRWKALLPGGVPRWIRAYDNGGGLEWSCPACPKFYDAEDVRFEEGTPPTCECGTKLRRLPEGTGSGDCFTVCFTGKAGSNDNEFSYRAMSAHPYHPQGIGMWGSVPNHHCDIDKGGWPVGLYRTGRMGKRIRFTDLPADCQRCVFNDYIEIWKL